MDPLFKPKEINYFGKELYGDELFTEKKESIHGSDTRYYGANTMNADPLFNDKNKLSSYSDSSIDVFKTFSSDTSYMSDFIDISEKPEFSGFTFIPWLKFYLSYEDEHGSEVRISDKFTSILVDKKYELGKVSQTHKSSVVLFVPYRAVGVYGGSDEFVFNRVHILNTSDINKDADIKGICRYPVYISKSFFRNNVSVTSFASGYDDNFYKINFEVGSHCLIKGW